MASVRICIVAAALICHLSIIGSTVVQALPVVGATEAFQASNPQPDPVDPVALSLRAVFQTGSGKVLRRSLVLTGGEFAALISFYEARGWNPVWTKGGLISQAGRSVISRLRQSAADGLDPSAYGTPSYQLGRMWPVSAREVARSEILISRSVIRYARHASIGRLRPGGVSRRIARAPKAKNPVAVLVDVSSADDPGRSLAAYNPRHPGFLALRARLADLRTPMEATFLPRTPIPTGPTMEPGQRHPRIALLRERLQADPPDTDPEFVEPEILDPEFFDQDLRAAVIEFQSAMGLETDGLVGRQTLAALNADRNDAAPSASVAGIVANMEMWRWMPEDLGDVHVVVNVPEFRLRIVNAGKTTHTTKVIVGKVRYQTPIFSDEMEHVVVNPYWNVPYSIAKNEMLSSIRANPMGYLQSRGYEVLYNGRRIHPASIYWDTETVKRVHIRQRPGAGNALGRVKFLFPNKHAVYLHDTPSRSLFKKDQRAFSHGCIRVNHPLKFADALLTADKTVSGKQIRNLLGKKERWVNLDRHIPVHISYFTTWVDGSGTLRTARDIYGHEKKVRELLRL